MQTEPDADLPVGVRALPEASCRAVRPQAGPARRLHFEKVILAILMDNGKELSPDTMSPLSQITLAHIARILGACVIDVEMIVLPVV